MIGGCLLKTVCTCLTFISPAAGQVFMLRLVSCRNYQEAVTGVTVKVLLRTHRQLSFKALIEGAMQECYQRPRNTSALWAVRWCLSPVWQNGTLLLKWPKLRTTKLWHLTVNIVHAATSAAASQTLPEHVKKEHMSHADNNILLWGVCALSFCCPSRLFCLLAEQTGCTNTGTVLTHAQRFLLKNG